MKIKKYTNGAWTDLDTPVKKFDEYTDEATTLPLTIETSKTNAVENYQVYGTSAGAGVQTENLINPTIIQGAIQTSDGKIVTIAQRVATQNFTFLEAGTYTISSFSPSSSDLKLMVFEYSSASAESYIGVVTGEASWRTTPFTFALSSANYIRISFCKASGADIVPSEVTDLVLTFGSTAPASFIPFGYKIPISNSDGTNTSNYDLFVGDSKLYEDEYLDFVEQKIYRTILLTTHDNKDFITSDNKRFCVRRSNNG